MYQIYEVRLNGQFMAHLYAYSTKENENGTISFFDRNGSMTFCYVESWLSENNLSITPVEVPSPLVSENLSENVESL